MTSITSTANAVYTSALRVFTRSQIGTSVNIDDPGVNGLFEIRSNNEVTYSGNIPFNGWAPFLNMKDGGNASIMQLAGSNELGFYIRGKQAADVTLSEVSWLQLMTGSMSVSGTTLTIYL